MAKKVIKLSTYPKAQSESLDDFTTRVESELTAQHTQYLQVAPETELPEVTFLPDDDFGIIICASFKVEVTTEPGEAIVVG